MNAETLIDKAALDILRQPFPPHQVSKMCRSTKKDNPKGKCQKCGGWHGLPSIQLEYVGHAALTDRLLDADNTWSWEPLSLDKDGLPSIDENGGMWIKLTICGVTRLGYGDAQGKLGGDAMKERIGDALRNAAMRFGAALDLWHKGDLHLPEEPQEAANQEMNKIKIQHKSVPKEVFDSLDERTQNELRDIAMEVINFIEINNLDSAHEYIISKELDNDLRAGLWSLFDSKQRTALTKIGELKKVA